LYSYGILNSCRSRLWQQRELWISWNQRNRNFNQTLLLLQRTERQNKDQTPKKPSSL